MPLWSMSVLLDESLPRQLKDQLPEHQVRTVPEAGWAGKKNGELLNLAESEFDMLITTDTNLSYQQNLVSRRIAIIVLAAVSNRLLDLRPLFPRCVETIEKINPGEIVRIGS